MIKIFISFIEEELKRIKKEGALDDELYKVLCSLNKTNLNDKGRALECGMSEKKFSQTKKIVLERVFKVTSKW